MFHKYSVFLSFFLNYNNKKIVCVFAQTYQEIKHQCKRNYNVQCTSLKIQVRIMKSCEVFFFLLLFMHVISREQEIQCNFCLILADNASIKFIICLNFMIFYRFITFCDWQKIKTHLRFQKLLIFNQMPTQTPFIGFDKFIQNSKVKNIRFDEYFSFFQIGNKGRGKFYIQYHIHYTPGFPN